MLRSALAGILALTTVVIVACSSEPASAPMPNARPVEAPAVRKAAPTAAPSAAAPAPGRPRLAARVYVDISGSMAGFFAPVAAQRGVTTPAMVHEEIDTSVAEVGLGSVSRCTVGDAVACDGVPGAPAKIADPRLYHAASSRLDRVLARAPRPAQIDPNQPPPVDALDDARVTLIVTDGMAVAANADASANGSTSCARGADPSCIVALLRKRIAEGYGAWLIGVRLPFRGLHFPERTLTPDYLERTRAHVGQLKFDPRNLGVPFEVGALGSDATAGGRSTYVYRGYKPLLVFVLSREPAVGGRLVAKLVKRLREAPIQPGKMSPNEAVQSIELAPLMPVATRATALELVSRPEQQAIFGTGFDPKQLHELRFKGATQAGGELDPKIWCGARGRAMLDLRYEQAGATTLPAYLRERIVLVPQPGIPPRTIAPPKPAGDRRIRTGLDCARLPAGSDTTLTLELHTELALDATARDAWWSSTGWSSEDAWQMPERVYRLEDIVLPILRDRATHPATWGLVKLHVHRD